MEKPASQFLDRLKAFANEHPTLLKSMLASGGVGAAAGAFMTGDDPSNPDETAAERIKRRITNALIGAGVGAAATGAIGYGLGTSIGQALPAGDVAPEVQAIHSPEMRGVGAAALGLGAMPFERASKDTVAKSLLGRISSYVSGLDKGTGLRQHLNIPSSAAKGEALETLSQLMKSDPGAVVTAMRGMGMGESAIAETLRRAGQNTVHAPGSWLNRTIGERANALVNSDASLGRLPNNLFGNTIRAGAKGIGHAGNGLAAALRLIGRNPRTAGLAAAGLMLPEALDVGGSVLGSMVGDATLN